MIRCEQKGPHQQVRFWLCLSVLPTAGGMTSPAGPAHPQPPTQSAALSHVTRAWTAPLEKRLGPQPQHPDTHSTTPLQDATCHREVFLKLPWTWDPSTPAPLRPHHHL